MARTILNVIVLVAICSYLKLPRSDISLHDTVASTKTKPLYSTSKTKETWYFAARARRHLRITTNRK